VEIQVLACVKNTHVEIQVLACVSSIIYRGIYIYIYVFSKLR
jgi:hypothetical protein